MRRLRILWMAATAVCAALGAKDVAVPAACTPAVNAKLADLLASGQQSPVDNVMVCGITTSSSHPQKGGPHGGHQVIPLLVMLPDGRSRPMEVVTNDALDGRVTAPKNAQVFAYGQAFFDRTGQFAAGLHETHCATHRGADNGWVVVNGAKFPKGCPSSR